jgi:hypothetical protein
LTLGHRTTYRDTGRSLYTRACRAQEVLCEEFKLPKEIRDFIFSQDPGRRLCCRRSGDVRRSRCGWLPIDCGNASLDIGGRQPLMKCLSRSDSDGTFRVGKVRRAKGFSCRVSRQRKKVGVEATRAHRACNHSESRSEAKSLCERRRASMRKNSDTGTVRKSTYRALLYLLSIIQHRLESRSSLPAVCF